MAEKDLIIKLNYDITEAEAKAEKFNRDIERSQHQVKVTGEEIVKTQERIATKKQQIVEIDRQAEASAHRLRQFEENRSAMSHKSYQRESRNMATLTSQHDRLASQLESEESKLARQEITLEKQKNIVQDTTAKYTSQMQKIDRLSNRLHDAQGSTVGMGKAFQGAIKPLASFEKRIFRLAKRVLIFSVITRALRSFRKKFAETVKENETLNKYLAQTKGNLSVIGNMLFDRFTPFLEWLLSAVEKVTRLIALVLARALGKDVKSFQNMAKSSKQIEKSAKKATASFDTLQTIDTSNKGGEESSGVGTSFAGLNASQMATDELDRIMAIASASALALGCILALTGVNIPLGIALIALGVSGMVAVAKLQEGKMGDQIDAELARIMAVASVSLMLLGLILVTAGQLPAGIGLMVAGAFVFATQIIPNYDKMPNELKAFITKLLVIVGGAMLVIGIILVCCGIITPMTIGMIIGGATALVTAVAINFNAIIDWFKRMWEKIKAFWNAHIAKYFTKDYWSQKFSNIWSGIKGTFKTFLNWIIGKLNKIGFTVPSWVPGLGGKRMGFNIPYLAKGAVIPGGRPFPAMLGDQPIGQTNIETPLDTMIQAFKTALAESGGQQININFTGNLSQLARVLNPVITQEQKRASVF